MANITTTQQDMGALIAGAPNIFEVNKNLHTRGTNYVADLLRTASENPMNDEIDQRLAKALESCSVSRKRMMERRFPLTRVLDDLKKQFTAMENDFDATKVGTPANQMQELRNQYAAAKRAEEQRQAQERRFREQLENTRAQMGGMIELALWQSFNRLLESMLEYISGYTRALTLANYDDTLTNLNKVVSEYPEGSTNDLRISLTCPEGISIEEFNTAIASAKLKLNTDMAREWKTAVSASKIQNIATLHEKKAVLEAMAKADAEEAARLQALQAEAERREAERREAERVAREEELKKQAEAERVKQSIANSFALTSETIEPSTTNVKVSKKAKVLNHEGWPEIYAMWWHEVGSKMGSVELEKLHRTFLTHVNKRASKDEVYIHSEHIEYVEQVKAK